MLVRVKSELLPKPSHTSPLFTRVNLDVHFSRTAIKIPLSVIGKKYATFRHTTNVFKMEIYGGKRKYVQSGEDVWTLLCALMWS